MLHITKTLQRYEYFFVLRNYFKELVFLKQPLETKIKRLEKKVNTLEDILEIDPKEEETIEITKKELDLTPLEDKIGEIENTELEEE